MRILGFSRKDWMNYLTGRSKLQEEEFTTFRFTRRDQDWGVGEVVQVVYTPRSKDREVLGVAEILSSESRWVLNAEDDEMKHYGDYFAVKVVTENEAIVDGFKNRADMVDWVGKAHRSRNVLEPMNKLTLRWV